MNGVNGVISENGVSAKVVGGRSRGENVLCVRTNRLLIQFLLSSFQIFQALMANRYVEDFSEVGKGEGGIHFQTQKQVGKTVWVR